MKSKWQNSNFDVIRRAKFLSSKSSKNKFATVCIHYNLLFSVQQHEMALQPVRILTPSYSAQLLGSTQLKMTPLFTSTSFSVLISFFFATLTVAFSTNSTTNSSFSSASLPTFPSCLKPNTSWAVKEDHNIIIFIWMMKMQPSVGPCLKSWTWRCSSCNSCIFAAIQTVKEMNRKDFT